VAPQSEVGEMHVVFLPSDRAFLRYLEIPGDDPPLLWLHGWQCSSTGELLPAAVQPSLRGRRSLLIDFLGHGYSDRPSDFAYTPEEHARTIVALIDAIGIQRCGLVGHSMGGAIAIRVAVARPAVVSFLVMAEGSLGDPRARAFEGQTEGEFVNAGFSELLAGQRADAEAQPASIRAAHLGITQVIEPRAIHREDVAMTQPTSPSLRMLLAGLDIPRWYLIGELSDPEGLEPGLAEIGVGWRVVPGTGHPMGLQNPAGLAASVAEIAAVTWPG
jgi:pimeloyl-ACP methyl ester carboxylesterase